MSADPVHDVVIAGGGPAGLSAALMLGRCLRNVVVLDAGRPRNERSLAVHGFLGSEGFPPLQFLARAREQLTPYGTVTLIRTYAANVYRQGARFVIEDERGRIWKSKALLLATGLIDKLPDVPGIEKFYGASVHLCPYCDGWENRGRRLGVIGANAEAIEMALNIINWSSRVTLFLNGVPASSDLTPLHDASISVTAGKISRLAGENGKITRVKTEDGDDIDCDALFFSPAQAQHSPLARKLGCPSEDEALLCGPEGCTSTEGLFVAGNASTGLQMAVVAAAEGLKAGAAIHRWLEAYEKSFLRDPQSP